MAMLLISVLNTLIGSLNSYGEEEGVDAIYLSVGQGSTENVSSHLSIDLLTGLVLKIPKCLEWKTASTRKESKTTEWCIKSLSIKKKKIKAHFVRTAKLTLNLFWGI